MKTPSHISLAALSLLTLLASSCSGVHGDAPQETPQLGITYPVNGELVSKTRFQAKGTAKHTDEVIVNGTPASVVGGQWSAEVSLGEGDATITVSARGAEETVDFSIDATPPMLTLTSPARASFIETTTENKITVSGQASDALSPLHDLTINNQVVDVSAEGNFSTEINLTEGVNTITIVAQDDANHTTQTTVGVMYGNFISPTERVNPGLDISADQSIFPKITDVLVALITPEQLLSLVKANLDAESQVQLTDISFDTPSIQAIPRSNQSASQPGYIDLALEIKNINIKGLFALSDDQIDLDVVLTQAKVTTTMTFLVNEEGGLDIAFGEPLLEIPDDALSWTVSAGGTDLNSEDSRLLSNIVDNVVKVAFSEVLTEQVIEQLYDPALLHRRVELLGRTLEFELTLEEIITNASGVFVRTSFVMPAESYPEIPDAPGALDLTMGPTSVPGFNKDAIISWNTNAVNRLLHGVWRSGLMNQRLEGSDFAGFEIPFELQTGSLAFAIDGRISNHADSDAPASIVLRPQLPPVVELEHGEEQDRVIANLAEFHVDLVLDADKPSPKKLATFALFMKLGVDLEVKEENRIGIKLSFEGHSDLIDEPLFDLDDQDVEELMQGLFLQIPALLSDQLVINGATDITWLSLSELEFSIHGLQDDQVSIGMTIDANIDGLSLP